MTKTSAPQAQPGFESAAALHRYQSLRRLWLAMGIAALTAAMLFVATAWGDEPDEFIEMFGVTLIGAAILGRLWCTLYIGGRKSGVVVTAGPYSIMRNPLYVFTSAAALGVGAQSGSLTVALVFGMFCVIAFQFVIRREERFLSSQFGTEYMEYLAKVPRFLPNPRLFRDETMLTVFPKRLYSTFLDGLVFFSALPAFEGIEYLQEIGVIPVLLRLY